MFCEKYFLKLKYNMYPDLKIFFNLFFQVHKRNSNMKNIVLTMAELLSLESVGLIKADYWYFAIINDISLKYMCFQYWAFFLVDITES